MTDITNRHCILHTLDGELDAMTAAEPHTDYGGRRLIRVQANNSGWAIEVNIEMVQYKFEGNECPTFYAC